MKQNQRELGNKLVVVAGGAGEIGERITRTSLQRGARVLDRVWRRVAAQPTDSLGTMALTLGCPGDNPACITASTR